MATGVYVVGVGMTDFAKPGTRGWDYPDMVREAGTDALTDACVTYEDVQQVTAGYCYGMSTSGQRACYELGLTGVPIYNVNNNCATGSTALFLAQQLVQGGAADVVLAVGFEKMDRGAISLDVEGRAGPLDVHIDVMKKQRGLTAAPQAAQLFGNAGVEHMERYGSTPAQMAAVAVKNHAHSVHNPKAQFQEEFSLDEVLASPMVFDFLTRLQCCPTSEGAAAAVLASESFVRERRLQSRAVSIESMAVATDGPDVFGGSMIELIGSGMSRAAATKVYEMTGYGPGDIDVIELHDCFTSNEVITYEALGLCEAGRGADLAASGATTFGGDVVVNPSGGLISKGHPLGATGLAQCAELTWQLRGEAGSRQVEEASVALQHNIGLGGAAVVGIYRGPAEASVG